MTIRFQLLLFVITGYLLVIAVFLFSIIQRDKVQEETSAESLVILYESAWYQNYNNNYEFMSKWIPNIGENGNIWDPYDETFIDEIEQVGNFSNPIVNSIKNRSIGDLQYIMELVFEEELDEGSLSFIMAYFPNSQRFYCGSSLDLFGIDACSPQAKPEFIDSINRFISDSSERPRQNIINIFDVENNKASTLNQIYSFPIKINQETIAIIILGIDIRKTLEIFEDEYEVRTAIKIPTGYVSLENDYSSDNSDLVSRYNINNYSETINTAENLFLENGSRTSLKVDNLGNSLTFIPLSSYLSSDKAQLFIIKDEKLSKETSNAILNRSFAIVTITILLIISLTTFINYRTFGGE